MTDKERLSPIRAWVRGKLYAPVEAGGWDTITIQDAFADLMAAVSDETLEQVFGEEMRVEERRNYGA